MGAARRIVPREPAAPPRARSYCSARISRLLAIPASARKWATGAGAQQDSRTDVRAGRRGAAESVPLGAQLWRSGPSIGWRSRPSQQRRTRYLQLIRLQGALVAGIMK